MRKRIHGFVESFCGPGGLSLGLKSAGMRPLFAFDYDAKAVETYRENIGSHVEVHDARDLTGELILDRIGLERGTLGLFSGGPPCQGFSKQKRGAHHGDDRNALVHEFIRLVQEIYPLTFLFENVAIFGRKRGKTYLEVMRDALSDYTLYPGFYNSADYGVPQTRERFIVVGCRKDLGVDFIPPSPTTQKWLTVREVIGDLPEPPLDYTDHPDFPNHQRARVTQVNIDRFSHVPPGGGWKDIPWELRLECHKRVDTSKGGWPDVYGRLEWDGQCPTITGGFDSFTRGRYGHPAQDRPLTPREAARMQGFPDDFVFWGTRADIRSQIGNAVPPPLARAFGIALVEVLDSLDVSR